MIVKPRISLLFLFLFLFLFMGSCAGIPPIEEYSLAHTALKAARKFEANKHASTSYRKALYFYKKGQASFDQRLYGLAKEHFDQCLEFAEKSEDLTRWRRYKKGDYRL